MSHLRPNASTAASRAPAFSNASTARSEAWAAAIISGVTPLASHACAAAGREVRSGERLGLHRACHAPAGLWEASRQTHSSWSKAAARSMGVTAVGFKGVCTWCAAPLSSSAATHAAFPGRKRGVRPFAKKQFESHLQQQRGGAR